MVIDYVSSDPSDTIFEKTSDRFRTYYIGPKKLISFMMKMDADVVVMSTPDLEKYQIKRSLVRNDVEYIYLPHGVNSANLSLRTGALDYFDTLFVTGPLGKQEIRAMEKVRGTKQKNLVEWGSSVIDNMQKEYEKLKTNNDREQTKTILIAPSWQEDNLIDLCIDDILDRLLETEYTVILRPHPQYIRYEMERLEMLKTKYSKRPNFILQTDFSSNLTVYQAALLITDWSGIAFEYSFATLKPTLFINTPMKVMNPEWKKVDFVPMDIAIRNQIGANLNLDKLQDIVTIVNDLIQNRDNYAERIENAKSKWIYSPGHSGEKGGEYIIRSIQRIEDNKEEYLKYI